MPSSDHLAVLVRSSAKVSGTVRGTLDSLDVIDDIGSGKIDRTAIKAIKNVQPHLFRQMQDEIRMQSAELAKKLPIQKQAAISRAFDVPVGSMFEPQAIAAYQATYAPQEAQQEQAPSPPQGEPIARAKKLRGPTEQIALGEES